MTVVAVAERYPFVLVEVEQRSPEWFAARLGLLTGSQAHAVLAQGRARHEESVMRRNLRVKLALERVTAQWIPDAELSTPAIKAGIEREPLAIAAYEAETGDLVQRAGFLAHRDYQAGCSPDGYVGAFDRLVSIKCRQPWAHYEFLRTGTLPPDAWAQARHELWVTGAPMLDYYGWNPDFPVELQARLVRIDREQADVAGYEEQALRFLDEVDREVDAVRDLIAQKRSEW